jgi:DNA-binding response OmpR family regulator
MKPTVLVVDDDFKTVELIRLYLERDGYPVLTGYDGRQAVELARRLKPGLIILDLMLPRVDGLEACRVLRAESRVPLIMLTAKTTEEDKLIGLDLGADDYVTKPFSPRELLARVRAVLRRAAQEESNGPGELAFGELVIDFEQHEARLRGAPVHLTPTEFALLETLARQPGRIFSRTDLLKKAFRFDHEGFERTVDVHIMNLRKKIEPDPADPTYIQTVYSLGYKFEVQEHV